MFFSRVNAQLRSPGDELSGGGGDGSIPPFGYPKRVGPPLKVLVVDDDPLNRQLLLRMLEKEGHPGEAVADGSEAVIRALASRFDVILMDVEMPGVDGLTATRQIRQRGSRESGGVRPYIIGVTAHDLPDDRARCLSSGMDDYLPKPIVRTDLRAALLRVPGGAGAGS